MKLGLSPFEVLRKGEPQAKELGLNAETPPGDIIKYIVQYPELLQRPIVEVGDKAILFVRPEALRVAAADAVNQFESEVLTSELEGSLIHVRLRGEAKAITVSLTNNGMAELPAPGARVRVGFDPDRAVVLPHGPLADE